jgi:hypothetical protein
MMLRIQKSPSGELAVFTLSGRIETENLAQLEALVQAEGRGAVLDLKEVSLVSREAVRLLARCEAAGTRLKDCPAYVREWIDQERGEN